MIILDEAFRIIMVSGKGGCIMDYGEKYKESLSNLIQINSDMIDTTEEIFVLCNDDIRQDVEDNVKYILSFLETEYVVNAEYEDFKELTFYLNEVFQNDVIYKYLLTLLEFALKDMLRVSDFKFKMLKEKGVDSFTKFDSDVIREFFKIYESFQDNYLLFILEYKNFQHYSLIQDYNRTLRDSLSKED